MASIHTFELETYLDKKQYNEIKQKLGIPRKKKQWTEHRYSKRGINIEICQGKKGFIYLRYEVNPQRIITPGDYLHLFNPTVNNISQVWKEIKKTWEEVGCGIPFGVLRLVRIDFSCDVSLNSEEEVREYIRLLNKCILISPDKKLPVEGIFHINKEAETKADLKDNCFRYEITQSEDIQLYNKIYQLINEKIPKLREDEYDGLHILRIELQVKSRMIRKWIRDIYELRHASAEGQFSYFVTHAEDFLMSRLMEIYMSGKFCQISDLRRLIALDNSLRKKSRQYAIRLVEGCNRNITLKRCLDLDNERNKPNKCKKMLDYLSKKGVSPVCIAPGLKGYAELPDIFELVRQ